MNLRFLIIFLLPLAACSDWVNDDLGSCVTRYRVGFSYDYNMKYAEAFPAEVRSINVWVFDDEGHLAFRGEAQGYTLAVDDFYIDLDLEPGRYSFLAWGGLGDGEAFSVANAGNPAAMSDLGCSLNLKEDDAEKYSDHEMHGLYHGIVENVTLERRQNQHTLQTVTVPMMKDTKRIAVMLQHIDGSPIGRDDFSLSITADNALLDWDNSVMASPVFTYRPWAVSYGTTSGDTETKATTSVSTLLAELSTSRLMAAAGHRLKVVRHTDGKTIIDIPLVKYLLLVKGNYHRNLPDQEYLDRQDDYSMMFFLTEDNTWYTAGGIYINSWAVVPPQEEGLPGPIS